MGRRTPLDVEALYAEHRDTLLLFLTRRTGDGQAALDLWAETWAQVTLHRRRHRGSTPEEAGAWLYAIARTQLATYHRRGAAERRALDRLELERPVATPEVVTQLEQRAGLAEVRAELARALDTLSPAVAAAVRGRVVDELPYPALAQRLGTTEPAARARVSRGLAALADALDAPTLQEALRP